MKKLLLCIGFMSFAGSIVAQVPVENKLKKTMTAVKSGTKKGAKVTALAALGGISLYYGWFAASNILRAIQNRDIINWYPNKGLCSPIFGWNLPKYEAAPSVSRDDFLKCVGMLALSGYGLYKSCKDIKETIRTK